MMFGLWARICSTPISSLARTLGSLLVRKTSDVATSWWRIPRPSGDVRSRPRLFFPRLECSSRACTSPDIVMTPLEARPRMASPRSTCSILMTSAPRSASSADAAGTKVCSATSRMRTPSITAVIYLSSNLSCRWAWRQRDRLGTEALARTQDAIDGVHQVLDVDEAPGEEAPLLPNRVQLTQQIEVPARRERELGRGVAFATGAVADDAAG